MRSWRSIALSVAVLLCWGLGATSVLSSPSVLLQADGSVQIAGRTLKCGNIRNALDSRLPNLGLSVPDNRLLIVNPLLLAREPETVRLFVFHHECGHHHVGGNELTADCWAVRRGVEDGWLSKAGLAQVCSSFQDAPATATHPSGAQRCGNLNRCFAAAAAEKRSAEARHPSPLVPQLVSGPRLLRNGVVP
jgi:hypothetical protein